MEQVPREEFVPARYKHLAQADRPLPIGYGQTISQPYVVALMTQLLELSPEDKVLEVGTGSGYQAAILSYLVKDVYTIEIIRVLAERAQTVFEKLNLKNIHTRVGDGYYGWQEEAPFDAILLTAAPTFDIPPHLKEQLADGGRLVAPVGGSGEDQILWRYIRRGQDWRRENWGTVAFVPFTRASGENHTSACIKPDFGEDYG
ncbi:MAG TPA: protein-L-isoaspartate(D-aspartate) O-methyltransferase [Firmicutes bacterium]|nr:protein-L-isoaspartate(D-aspartate) O-methyltransferase [Bacillota bacterium]